MRVDFEQGADVLLAHVRADRVDAATAAALKSRIGERLDQGAHKVVLNLAEVQFVDSTGLGALLSLLKRVPPGGVLVLCGCVPSVMEVMKLTRLDRIFQIFPDANEASLGLARSPP